MTTLTKDNLATNPLTQFAIWFEAAKEKGEIEPTAMTLATVNAKYEVSARIVLLKEFSEKGFSFFTNFTSPKATALNEINHAALVFWWPKSKRQVRITGVVSMLDSQSSDKYFSTRSKASCLSALASKQSSIIPDRDFLMAKYYALEEKYANQAVIPRPDFWGGYILKPESMEFWQAADHRLHDRFLYQKKDETWQICQLSP